MKALPLTIEAPVIHGNHLGRQIGYPTANLDLSGQDPFPLTAGVYAVVAIFDGMSYLGMANAGFRPTINGNSFSLEVHLFDFSGDLYGKRISVTFLHHLREEKKFDGIDALVSQIRRDEDAARKLLG
ncbi:MAG TPA: riboflavin kinase [Bacteroidales bacterium]|nr:riboflavin kinase [Bacteroidales bacterium]